MSGRDHSEMCSTCGFEHGGLNDVVCACEMQWATDLRIERDQLRAENSRLKERLGVVEAAAWDALKVISWFEGWIGSHPYDARGVARERAKIIEALNLAKATASAMSVGLALSGAEIEVLGVAAVAVREYRRVYGMTNRCDEALAVLTKLMGGAK